MRRSFAQRSAPAAGFTLIELMVTVVIATILFAIAVPSYQNQIRKSRRTEAKTALLDLAGREERYMSTNGSYTGSLANLGWSTTTTSSGYYTISAPTVTAAIAGTATKSATPATFLLTATATGLQAKDTQCALFTVDQAGNQLSTPNTGCW